MNILALDLGTKTGWAALIDGVETSGVLKLATDTELKKAKKDRLDRRNDLRITRLFQHLALQFGGTKFDWVFFEDVQFLSTQLQAQLWASLRASVWLSATQAGVNIDCLPVGTLKKFATGKGNATKEEMIAALGMGAIDDNQADALHLLRYAKTKLI